VARDRELTAGKQIGFWVSLTFLLQEVYGFNTSVIYIGCGAVHMSA
jgi:hypothetical protein